VEYGIENCPKCKKELHVPEELKTCICMYCGTSFNLKDDTLATVPENILNSIEIDYHKTFEDISCLVDNYEQHLKEFKKDKYTDSFLSYAQTGNTVLQPADRFAARLEESLTRVVNEVSKELIDLIENDIAKSGHKSSSRNMITEQYRFFLTVYTVPMISHLNYSISEPLTDKILEEWRKRFPKYEFKKGKFEDIQAGFIRKGLCFITTAVCETMGKSDDCYELTAFRKFRDTYMNQTKERQALVKSYYEIAPAIVVSINQYPDSKVRYQSIWQNYLLPCLKDIEKNEFNRCEEHYSKMIYDLTEEYFIP